jgi:hypothetical protein
MSNPNQLTPNTMSCIFLVDSLPIGTTKREYYFSDISSDISSEYFGALNYLDGCFCIVKNSADLEPFSKALNSFIKKVNDSHIKRTHDYNNRIAKHIEQINTMDKQGYKLEFLGNGKEAKDFTFYPHLKNSFQRQEAGSLEWVAK